MNRAVYLHGFASSPASRKARYFRERFAERGWTLEVPDLAEGNFEGLTITGQFRAIERLLDGAPADLIGSSMGGYLAALYASRHPEVRRVVLMAPAFGFVRRWPARLGEPQFEQWRDSGFLPVFHYGEQGSARVGFGLFEDALQYEDAPEVRQPTLLFHGLHDDVVPVEASREFASGRPHVTLRVLDSDHELGDVLPLMWSEAEAFLTQES